MNAADRIAIRTPEGIHFSLKLADPLRRMLALALDAAVVVAVMWCVGMALSALGVVFGGLAAALYTVAGFIVSVGYGIALEWWLRGQTLGKRLLRLRVVDAHGLRLQFGQVLVRNLMRPVDQLPACYLVGAVAALLTRHGQRLGDLAANTIVVHEPKRAAPDIDRLLSDKFNSFRNHPHLAARLRRHVSPAEASIALRALARRATLDPDARLELFGEIADHFRELVAFPEQATDGLSDEAYVRNVADVIYRPKG